MPGTVIKSHSHEYYHLLCVCSGRMSFTLDDTPYTLTDGDVILVPKDTAHAFRNDTDLAISYYEIKFTVLSGALSRMLHRSRLYLPADRLAAGLVEQVMQEYLYNRTRSDEAAESALTTLLYHITAAGRLISPDAPELIDTRDYSPLSKKVVAFLTANFDRSLSLDDVSAGVGISKNYLCNAFKRSTGITILECLNLIRIRKAAELIVYSDLSLAQVSGICGYVSVSHFNRLFSHYTGIPPGQCRRAYSSFHLDAPDGTLPRQPDTFMYSVLAGKSISPATINAFVEQDE